MSFKYLVTSGNIGAGISYFVQEGIGSFITYNSITVSVGESFIGVDGVTTYTKDTGTEEVYENSIFSGIELQYVNTFYLGLFADISLFSGIELQSVIIPYFTKTDTVVHYPNNALQDGWNNWGQSMKMNPLNNLDLLRICGQDNTDILDYDGVIALIAANGKVTGTVDGDGVLTDLKSESA